MVLLVGDAFVLVHLSIESLQLVFCFASFGLTSGNILNGVKVELKQG